MAPTKKPSSGGSKSKSTKSGPPSSGGIRKKPSSSKPKPSITPSRFNKAKQSVPHPKNATRKPRKPASSSTTSTTGASTGTPGTHLSKKQANKIALLEKDLPKLNMIQPAGVVKPKSGKKGKVFVGDAESGEASKRALLGLVEMVNEGKEGVIKSKLERGRQLEIIRAARAAEQEARMEMRKSKLDGAKDIVRKKRKRGKWGDDTEAASPPPPTSSANGSKGGKGERKKRVSFA